MLVTSCALDCLCMQLELVPQSRHECDPRNKIGMNLGIRVSWYIGKEKLDP